MGDAGDPERTVTIAVLQAGADHSAKGNPGPEANFELLARLAREAASARTTSSTRPDLIVFPEYAISGWPYPPEDVINGVAEPVPGGGPWFGRYAALARELETALLCWIVEDDGGSLYNASFLLDAQGALAGKYRKVHANLGEQTWWGWSQGTSLEPVGHDGVRYGISICADMWFPETVRCEELLGADVIVHQSIADDMGHVVPTRAFDNEIPIVCAVFNGGSYAVDSRGNLLGKLPAGPPGWKAFELQPFGVRTDRKYGGLWVPKLGHRNLRNVGAYSILTDRSTRPPWTRVFLDGDGNPQTEEELKERFKGPYDAKDPARPGAVARGIPPGLPPLWVCGDGLAELVAPGRGGPAGETLWAWDAGEAAGLPPGRREWFGAIDEVKPARLDSGREAVLLSSSGRGGAAAVDRESGRLIFCGRCANAHSVELLPGGLLAVAGSAGTDEVQLWRLADGPEAAAPVARTPLTHAHGVVWDPGAERLWTCGAGEVVAFRIAGGGDAPVLCAERRIDLPEGGAHNLSSDPRGGLLVSTSTSCWLVEPATGDVRPFAPLERIAGVKSISVESGTGVVAFQKGEGGNWWSENVYLLFPDGRLRMLTRPGRRLYKARWDRPAPPE